MHTASHLELTLGFLPQCQEPISFYKPCVKKLTGFRVIAQKRQAHSQQINSLDASSFRWETLEVTLLVFRNEHPRETKH